MPWRSIALRGRRRDSVVARMSISAFTRVFDALWRNPGSLRRQERPAFPPAVAGVMRATTACGGRWDARPSVAHPFVERPVHGVRPLHGGKVPAVGNDDEPRSGDAGRDLLR